MDPYFQISSQVADALSSGRPVVALESTIFTHGLPRPRNIAVALEAEDIVRREGAVPATIGVHRGIPTVGLDEDQIHELAYDDIALKSGIRELPLGAVLKKNAGTTISGSIYLARRAGIDVFATGGLGGVHHGAHRTYDESADLIALSRTPIVVISSGAKAILDVAATLERLETLCVPIVGYRTHAYPGFYVADSGHRVTHRLESADDIATVYRAQRRLDTPGALLVGNPIPTEAQLDPTRLEETVTKAWAAADERGINGQGLTPFLLEFIRAKTGGASLEANVALYRNNVQLATQVALSLKAAPQEP
ncbi:Pseudouridine-5'-phosphate glycosidase [Austwickia sp. TVS 96-490-7B]|uniref:pseudouridine-5'-phosphate glycosidase n=1 Tax=Austwickia sp. TVS 96-490-7B TaxID=2830843 RepID=UPI001C59E960|nr:pseudouridine-5'-phosphate glycosidase [Austwickia sp. TVS 96-490-7B]MBW3085505.1 Pseudouridine-5'-phosphate glycosidase [Austwickia sp. TVS 96-490-7B]